MRSQNAMASNLETVLIQKRVQYDNFLYQINVSLPVNRLVSFFYQECALQIFLEVVILKTFAGFAHIHKQVPALLAR